MTDAADSTDPPGARVGDAERERTAVVLSDAAAEGYLAMAELDERLSIVWSARVRSELADVVADLPAGWRHERSHREAVTQANHQARAALRPQLRSYLRVMALLIGIWLAVGVAAGAWYPWPIWPALGWGAALLGRGRSARARTARRRMPPSSVSTRGHAAF